MAETALAERFPEGVSGKRVHAVGAGGHGISAGVALAYARGALVTCCDVSGGAMSHLLANAGIPLTLGHDPSHVAEADLVVVSPAVTYLHPDLPELVAAVANAGGLGSFGAWYVLTKWEPTISAAFSLLFPIIMYG